MGYIVHGVRVGYDRATFTFTSSSKDCLWEPASVTYQLHDLTFLSHGFLIFQSDKDNNIYFIESLQGLNELNL